MDKEKHWQLVLAHEGITSGEKLNYTSRFLGCNKDLAKILIFSQKRYKINKESFEEEQNKLETIDIPSIDYNNHMQNSINSIDDNNVSNTTMDVEEFKDLCSKVVNVKNRSVEESIEKINTAILASGDIMKFMNLFDKFGVSNVAELYELIDKKYNNCTPKQYEKLIQQLNYWLNTIISKYVHDYEDEDQNGTIRNIEEIRFIISGDFFKGKEGESEKVKKMHRKNPYKYTMYYSDRLKNDFPDKYETLSIKYNHDYKDIIIKALAGYKRYAKKNKNPKVYQKALEEFADEISMFYEYILSKRIYNAKYSEFTLDKLFFGEDIGDILTTYDYENPMIPSIN